MTNVSLRLIARLIIHMEYLCLVGLILFTEGHIPVRLVNPSSSLSNPFAGRLEVRWHYSSYGSWGTVCDNNFTDAAARVVCAMLGFRTGSFIKNAFGPGSGRIWLDDVRCTGSESNISSCNHSSWGSHSCRQGKEVSISCGYTPVKLVNPYSSLPNPGAGRFEVWYGGTWSSVCAANHFTDAAAYVICNSLGFGRTGKFIRNLYGSGSGQIWLHDVNCAGSETSIDNCSRIALGTYNCQVSNEVSIECDVDECTTGENECVRTTGYCVNTVGSYNCSCIRGYENIRSTTCTDIDECTTGRHGCVMAGTICANTIGGYHCSDIDECSTGQSLCDEATTTCVNTHGGYGCSCKNGFKYSNFSSCTDNDECNAWQSPCYSATTTCVNTEGSYHCLCRNGFENNNNRNSRHVTCTDIDECTRGRSQCDAATTTCVNTVGSYYCSCKKGFKYSNFSSCTDIDECISDDSECDPMSTDCINRIGGNYTCNCKDGFTYLNETACMAAKESSLGGFGIGAIVGSSVGAFLVLASIAIVVLMFHWKRRKGVNQPSQRQRSQVDNGSGGENNYRNPSVENNCGNPIIYMELDQTALGMGRKTANNTQMESSNRLPVPTEKPKETAISPVYGNVQSSIYATVVPSVDDKAQSAIYGNVQY